MIITCPECTTRYDVNDERFSSAGRSVRCTACGEAWFVPPPEPIDVDPIEELTSANRAPEGADEGEPKRGWGRAKGQFDAEPDEARGGPDQPRQGFEDREAHRNDIAEDAEFDDDEDDSLFGSPSEMNTDTAEDEIAREEETDHNGSRDRRHGFGFTARRFGRSQTRHDDRNGDGDERDNTDSGAISFIKHLSRKEREPQEVDNADEKVVDADWEDVKEADAAKSHAVDDGEPAPEVAAASKIGGDRRRGFGRRASDFDQAEDGATRNDQPGGSEIARLADVGPFDPEEFDEEFFSSLQVTPKALARALKKTRRRAESRQKNRLTPFRAFGWAIWLVAVVGAAFAIVTYRDEIVKIAPKTADAYAIIGIEANPHGLVIEDVEHRLAMSTGGAMIEISGKLKNKGDEAIAAPLMQAEALGPRGELLSRWTFSPNDTEVLEGAAIDFITRAPAPDGVAEVALSFAPAKSSVSELLSGGE